MFFEPAATPIEWVVAGALLVCAGVLGAAAITREPGRAHWAGLSAVALFLALDEALNVHRLLRLLPHALWHGGPSGFKWTVAALLAAGVVAVVYAPFVRRLPRRLAVVLLLGGGVFLVGLIAEKSERLVLRLGASGGPVAQWVSDRHEIVKLAGVVILGVCGVLWMRAPSEQGENADEAGSLHGSG